MATTARIQPVVVEKNLLVRSTMNPDCRLIVPVSPSTWSCAPCHPISPASVTTNDGIPKKFTKNPWKAPITMPATSAAITAVTGDQPCGTLSTGLFFDDTATTE